MKKILFLSLLLLFIPVVSYAQVSDGKLLVGDMERSYQLYVPESYDEAVETPLVIVLHGSGGSGIASMVTTQFMSFAEQTNTIVAYPNGYRSHWDYLDKKDYAPDADVADNVMFIKMLIAELTSSYHIDPNRIYVTGYSSGGLMTLRLMCELPVAGVAIVSATGTPEIANHCLSLKNPVDTLVIVGTEDSSFPRSGSAIVDQNGFLSIRFSIAQVAGFISSLFHCDNESDIVRIDDDSSEHQVVRETRSDCDGANFEILYIFEQSHAYPVGTRLVLQNRTVGSVDEYIWEFFGLSS